MRKARAAGASAAKTPAAASKTSAAAKATKSFARTNSSPLATALLNGIATPSPAAMPMAPGAGDTAEHQRHNRLAGRAERHANPDLLSPHGSAPTHGAEYPEGGQRERERRHRSGNSGHKARYLRAALEACRHWPRLCEHAFVGQPRDLAHRREKFHGIAARTDQQHEMLELIPLQRKVELRDACVADLDEMGIGCDSNDGPSFLQGRISETVARPRCPIHTSLGPGRRLTMAACVGRSFAEKLRPATMRTCMTWKKSGSISKAVDLEMGCVAIVAFVQRLAEGSE